MSEIPTQPTGLHPTTGQIPTRPPRADLTTGDWARSLIAARNVTPTGLVALARRLDVEGTPQGLRLLARAYLEDRLYRADRPRARSGDPETSQAAAEAARGPAKPGGTVHRILEAYEQHRRTHEATDHGLTAREVERASRVRAAHKRTSELLADGLLEVDRHAIGQDGELVDHVRKGGRILKITNDGQVELARLNAARAERGKAEAAKVHRKLDARVRWGVLEELRKVDGFRPIDRVGLTLREIESRLGTHDQVVGMWVEGHVGQGLVEYPRALDGKGQVIPNRTLKRGGYPVLSITDDGVKALERRDRNRTRDRARRAARPGGD